MPELRDYLGDSVCADYDGCSVTLTTNNGHGPSNTIVLEPEVLAALNRYVERVRSIVSEERKEAHAND